jgi:putative membrane protein
MLPFLIRWFVMAVAVFVAANIVPGVDFHGNYGALAVAALLLGILNALLRPIKIVAGVLTLGILTLLINGFLLWLVGRLVKDFTVTGFWSAVLGALIVSVVSFMLNLLIEPKRRVIIQHHQSSRPQPQRDDNVIDV